MQDIVGGHHQHARLELCLERQRHVHGHLVTVEVGVERRANERVQLDRLAFDQHRFECLNAKPVQRRCAIEQHRVLANDLVENIPDLGLLLFDEFLRLLDRCRQPLGIKPRIDERFEQLERHLLRQPALMQLELRTNDDNRTARIVDALAEQVLTEPALLALQHVSERLERPLVGARDHPPAAAVIEQRVHRLLQHPLLVADDDVRGTQLDQPLQSVVAVDDAAIEIVQIGRRETATVERNQRAQIRRDDRDLGQDHPLRLVARGDEGLNQLEPLGELLGLEFGRRLRDFLTQIGRELLQVERLEHLTDGLGADHGGERIRPQIVLRFEVFLLAEELALLKRRQTGLEHDIVFEIEDAFEVLQRHVEQQSDTARQRLEEPDVRDRSRELDVPHALATHA